MRRGKEKGEEETGSGKNDEGRERGKRRGFCE